MLRWFSRRPYDFPKGGAFLKVIAGLEDECSSLSRRELARAGRQVPRCLDALGDMLSLSYQAASCHWGCRGPDHAVNHLAVKAATSASASLRCLLAGYYDESLALTRTVGEVANLLLLFVNSPESFEEWRRCSPQARRREFSPYRVRERLEGIGHASPIQAARYSALSERGVHVSPDTVPQAHNPAGRAVLGHIFQLPGAIAALTELAIALGVAAHLGAQMLQVPPEVRRQFDDGMRVLVDALPAIDILNVNELLTRLGGEQDQTTRPG